MQGEGSVLSVWDLVCVYLVAVLVKWRSGSLHSILQWQCQQDECLSSRCEAIPLPVYSSCHSFIILFAVNSFCSLFHSSWHIHMCKFLLLSKHNTFHSAVSNGSYKRQYNTHNKSVAWEWCDNDSRKNVSMFWLHA